MSSQISSNISGPNKAVATGLPPRHKIIVAIDYGTTFSGIIYVLSTQKNSDELKILYLHADHKTEMKKVPSRIAYARENPRLKSDQWGFDVDPKQTSCSWTKLLLDKSSIFGEDDDIISKTVIDEGMMHLPSHRNCNGVCEDFLHALYVEFAGYAERTLGTDVFKMSPIDCWITLPAIWSDEAKHATLNAARKAGFATNPMDQVHTIVEPEAAAIATLKELAAPGTLNAVQRGDNVLICDCGGGTVDITTYTVTSVAPKLTFEELCIGTGGKCGSTYIDRHLHDLLSDHFGNDFDSIPYSRKGPGSVLMNNWEVLKKGFGRNMEEAGTVELGPLYLDLPSSHQYDREDNVIFLSPEDMKSVFDPIVDRVIKLVRKQVDQAKYQRKAKIHRIALVGGMGASKYLYSKLLLWCVSNGNIELLCPVNLELAVLRGAGIRALEELAPCIKYVRRHYGFRISRVFREFIDEEKYSYIDDYSNQKYCAGRAIWCVSKGDVIVERSFHSEGCSSPYNPGKPVKSTIELYSCEGDQQPNRMDDPRAKSVGRIPYSFPADFNFGMDSNSRFNQRLDKMVHEFHFQIQVIFRDRGANLKFRLAVGGRVVSDTTIKFPEH
ncbi:putative hsp70 family protein [Botrytis fragariae]|uniref:Putative hsp70 family protein n=1 Tax=Botrytis fragariae TaxID=1964551 RepID=A0A8H6B0T0_9HELO|nr:putative hsp70 family protein [Botrytis fragariae]KAF5877191.1 putative hsp70 family protein [Botrytis fragariae]